MEIWRLRVTALPLLLLTLCWVGLAVCWNGASHEVAFRYQTDWLVWAVVSTAVGLTGIALWITANLRELRRVQKLVLSNLSGVGTGASRRTASHGKGAETALTEFVHSAGSARFHRPTCLFVRGKSPEPITAATAVQAGLMPCGACSAE